MNVQVSAFAKYKGVVFTDKGITHFLGKCAGICPNAWWGTRKDNGKSIMWATSWDLLSMVLHAGRGSKGRAGGAGAVSCLPHSPTLGIHPLFVSVTTAISFGALHWVVHIVCSKPLGQ